MSRIVGIDLGTTNSLVAYVDGRHPAGHPGRGGAHAAAVDRRLHAGRGAWSARRPGASSPATPRAPSTRSSGSWAAATRTCKDELAHLPFEVLPSAEVVQIRVGDREVTPPEVSAHVLRALKQRAEAHFGEPVEQAVITVPAYFNDAQRQATKDAGRIAGLDVLRIVNEPTAAVAGLRAAEARPGDHRGLRPGRRHLRHLDPARQGRRLRGARHQRQHAPGRRRLRPGDGGVAPRRHQGRHTAWTSRGDPEALQELRLGAEAAKCRLSFDERTALTIPFEGFTYHREITRAELEALIEPLVDATLGPCRQALADAGARGRSVDEVVLVGGSTRMPLVRRRVRGALRPDARTASINPDEVVALGAAVQAQILAGGITDMLLLDVTPLSLGIETLGGIVSVLIPRNTTIPTLAKEYFTTSVDGQTTVDMHVLQGERELAKDNRSLARFDLAGIDPMPGGHAQDRGDVPHRRQRHPAGAGDASSAPARRRPSRSSRPTASPRPRWSRWWRTRSRTRRPTSRRGSSSRRRPRPTPCINHVERALSARRATWPPRRSGPRSRRRSTRCGPSRAGTDRERDPRAHDRRSIRRPSRSRSRMMDAAIKGAVTSKRADQILEQS